MVTGPSTPLMLIRRVVDLMLSYRLGSFMFCVVLHSVLQVFIRQKDKAAGLSTEVKVAKMSLIDLAGSEKGGVTGNKGAR